MPDLRELKPVERTDFVGWGCSHCDWVFCIPEKIKSDSLDDLIRQTESIRDAAFLAHDCASHPRGRSVRSGA